jgi:hypothetical protein
MLQMLFDKNFILMLSKDNQLQEAMRTSYFKHLNIKVYMYLSSH